jgi:hypothetical protein
MISRSLESRISSSQIVPVIVLPSLLISGSSGSDVLLTHPASDVDLDEDPLPSVVSCADELEDEDSLFTSSSSFSFDWSSASQAQSGKSESPIPHSTHKPFPWKLSIQNQLSIA